jgi:hypothetical protein
MAQLLEIKTRRQGLKMIEHISYGVDMSDYLNMYNKFVLLKHINFALPP